jgi:hypothetical protein
MAVFKRPDAEFCYEVHGRRTGAPPRRRLPVPPPPGMTRSRALVLLLGLVSGLLLTRQAEAELSYFPLTPCRLVDTRDAPGPSGGPALVGGTTRAFTISGVCGVPPAAQAAALNFTVVGATGPQGFLTVFPTDTSLSSAALLEFGPGQSTVVSNSANLALSFTGAISAFVSNVGGTVHLIINVYGYFAPAGP